MGLLATEFITPCIALLLIVLAGFTSFVSAAFGAGGGLMLLVVMASIMPMTVVVPVHGLVQLGSNANRLVLSIKHIDKSMFIYFTLGGLVGAGISSTVVNDIQLDGMKLAVAVFVVYLLWGKTPKFKNDSKLGRLVAGLITAFISMFVGASGPLVASYLHINNYDKLKFTATFSSIMTLQHVLKAFVYTVIGFNFWQWLPLVIGMIASGALGTWLGIYLLKRMPTARFKTIFKVILTLMACQLVWQGISEILL
ncbi:sulfite exporter TauE/SafE family protein [Pseudoalteromonas sp. SG44-5]|uniref:sulfite exporter TauE/SafE family protein n=1 Tax=Pseudoalteromonas sp. SG44-5 TaxID=2760960 RepID=UPI0015F9F1AB|nr:sulfite exporter TauE/SafE family protein [Pseudoalteromonas sp. SG44-5]MBB1406348.1 sulfite exporter TauE/SafE family protein [Pseudoalteromonas sp. SG44-5]